MRTDKARAATQYENKYNGWDRKCQAARMSKKIGLDRRFGHRV